MKYLICALALLYAGNASAQTPPRLFQTGCYERQDTAELVAARKVSETNYTALALTKVQAFKCVGVVILKDDYEKGIVRDGVKEAQAYPYKGVSALDLGRLFDGGVRPPKQLMYFMVE